MATPSRSLPSALMPPAAVPMKLPYRKLFEAPWVSNTPLPALPEIRFPSGGRSPEKHAGFVSGGLAGVVPPMVLFVAPAPVRRMPWPPLRHPR